METNLFFLNNDLTLSKVVTDKNILTINHEHEMNGLVRADIELDLDYALEFLEDDIDYVGYYYADEFYLHKIISFEHDYHENVTYLAVHHIFFEDMSFGAYIEDLRPQNQDASFMLGQTIDVNTRWRTFVEDTTGRLSTNFYWESPQEVLDKVVDLFKLEYVPKIVFDGKNIQAFHLEVARKIGNPEYKRIDYNSKILELKHEMDYSEIVTKLIPHGKGEEVGDGYGRRINIEDVEYNKDGIKSPKGSLYLEDTNKTALYGNDGQTPRVGRVIFEDVTNPTELARLAAEHYEEISQPKMLFSAKVSDIGTPNIGDTIVITRREYGIAYKARVMKIKVDLLNLSEAEIELGDYEFFQGSKVEKKQQQMNSEAIKRNGSLLQQAKDAWNEWFNSLKADFKADFEQAKIDTFALIEAERLAMQTLLDDKLNEFNDEYYALVDEAYKNAEENYARIEQEITTAVDTTRSEIEQGYTDAVEQAKRYAEEQSKTHSDAVESKLDTVTGSHAGMLADLQSNVMDIDVFLGDSRSVTLDERFQNITENFEERIRNIDSTHYNIIRGTSFDNPDLISKHSSVEIITNETDNFARLGLGTTNIPYVMPTEYFNVKAGQTYHLIFMYRTDDVPEIDFIRLRPPNGYGGDFMADVGMTPEEKSTTMSGAWTKKEVSFVPDRDMPVRLLLGTNFGDGDTQRGILDIKKPYLTTTNNREWLPHPDDDTQNVSEIVRRVTLLEDGRSELITRSEYDFDTGNLDQYIKSVEETVEGNKQVLQRVDNWQATNGASIEETIYGFNQKVWLNDISSIGANIIPQSSNAWEDGGLWIEGGGESGSTQHIRTKERIPIQPNTTYTLSSNSTYVSAIERADIHQYLHTGGWINRRTIPRNGEVTFTTWGTASHVRIALVAMDGFAIPTSFIDHPDGRIKIKLEVGDKATPMLNAISRIEQLADRVSLQVQNFDGSYLKQTDIELTPDYWQIGNTQIGATTVSGLLRGDANAIDAIVSEFNLTGNLNAKGQITSLAVDAIEGNFSRLYAAELNAGNILAKHIASDAIQARHLYVSNAMVEKIAANSVFANEVTAKALNAIDVNAGRVRAAILEADVITGTHLAVGTSMINKLFATSGRIDQLITKNHFVTNVKAMSIEAVEGRFSSLMTRYLSANYIDVDYINGKNAWFEKMYTTNALIEKLVAQTVFANGVRAIEITSNQLNIRTLHDKLKSVEGGLTIYGPDGRVLINNSLLKASFDVQVYDSFGGSEVDFSGLNFHTTSTTWQTIKYFYTEFKGSKLLVSWAVGLASGGSASEYVEVRTRGFGSNNPIGTSSSKQFVSTSGGTTYYNQTMSIGVPNYSTIQAYLDFRRSPTGTGVSNRVYARILRVSMID